MAYLVRMVGGGMEMITLLKANIRHKKGSFTSVILLTMIVAMSVTIILSMKESSERSTEYAHEMMDTPNLWVRYIGDRLTKQMVDEVKEDSNVSRVIEEEHLIVEKTVMGKEKYTDLTMLSMMPEGTKLLKEDLEGIAGDAKELKKGEIYISQGLLTNVHGKVSDDVTIQTLAGSYSFTVKGIILDPMFGASVIGYKKFYISDADYVDMRAALIEKESEEQHGIGKSLSIYKADSCKLTDARFRRQLNKDTGVVDMGGSSITKEMLIYYTTLFPQIISSILMVFILFLLAIVLIVMVHSISLEIETNYVMFGMLKAQGFTTGKLRVLFLFQYLIAEMSGSILGLLFSIPIIGKSANICTPITGIPATVSVPLGSVLLIFIALFLLSVGSIMLITVKLSGISPIRAISGAKKEIYFDSRLNAPISKRLLAGSLALRQFTSAKRRYAITFVVVAILVFFMMTMSMLSNTVTSKSALESMGMMVSEIVICPKKQLTDKEYNDIEKEIERVTKIEKKYYMQSVYFSFDGEEIMGQIYKNPEALPALKGRAPVYDNEIAVSPVLLDEFNLAVGDEVLLSFEDKKERYLITGTMQLMNDTGRCFVISSEGAERIGCSRWLWGCYSLKDASDSERIAASLNKQFGDWIDASGGSDMLDETYQIALDAMRLIIYVFSIIFAFIVVYMVCSKAFIGERRDIGIYKALGFTCVKLRMQFAIRFFIVAVLGSLLGGTVCYAFSGKMISILLYRIGITSFQARFDIVTVIIPVIVICISFFVFSYLASGKVKKVGIKELVME